MKQFNKPAVSKPYPWLYIILISLLAIFLYFPSLQNSFVNYDDTGYITQNTIIHNISLQGLKVIFSSFVMGNYHPLVVLSDALLFHFFSENSFFYHAFSLLLHVLNILLVFQWIYLLSGKKGDLAAIVALLFAIHPMHVETVCWASDLKDLQYTIFYVAALIIYSFYLKSGSYKFLLTSGILFIASLLSKSAAVTLPLVLLLVDYYYGRKITAKTIAEKVPFFILSIAFGLVNIHSQQAFGAFPDMARYNIIDRICIPCYSIIYYLGSLFAPMHFAIIHPLPEKLNGQPLAWQYYASPFVLLLVTGAAVWSVFKYPAYRKILVFGLLFFLVTISLVVQVRPIGQSVVSERYTYLPYVGLSFIVAYFFSIWTVRYPGAKTMMRVTLAAFALFFLFTAYQRTKAWENGVTLFNDEIENFQDDPGAYKLYEWRGDAEKNSHDLQNASNDFSKSIELNPDYVDAYVNRGVCRYEMKDYNGAFNDYTKALQFAPGRAYLYGNIGDIKQSLNDHEGAIAYFSKQIGLDPRAIPAYFNRASNKFSLKDYNGALSDYDKVVELDASSNVVYAYYNRGNVKIMLNNFQGAINDYNQAISINKAYADAYMSRGSTRYLLKDTVQACSDWNIALGLGHPGAAQYIQAYCR